MHRRRIRGLVHWLVTCGVLAACNESSRRGDAGGGAAPVAFSAPLAASSAAPLTAASADAALEERLGLYVPRGGASQRLPLVVLLHGLGGSGSGLAEHLRVRRLAEAESFAFLAPEGPKDFAGRQFWNATRSCCDFDGSAPDHVGELARLLTEAARHSRIDARRVALVGFSNGGFLAHRAACELAPRLHAIVSIAGAGPGKDEPCTPTAAVNVLQIHGTSDPIVSYEGGHLFADTRRPRHPSATATVERWARSSGCSMRRAETGLLDLDPSLPGAETHVESALGCPNDVRVELWRIEGGQHVSGLSARSMAEIWRFVATLEARTP